MSTIPICDESRKNREFVIDVTRRDGEYDINIYGFSERANIESKTNINVL